MSEHRFSLNATKLLYVLVWVVGAAWAALSETEVVPTDYLPHDAQTEYIIGWMSIVTAIGGTYLALRLLAFKAVRRKLREAGNGDEEGALGVYLKWAGIRLAIAAVAVLTNVVLYYASAYSTSTQYCLLIALVGIVFCWPSRSECANLTAANDKQ